MFIDPTLGIFLPFIWLLVWLLSRDSHRSYPASNGGKPYYGKNFWRDRINSKCYHNTIEYAYKSENTGMYIIDLHNEHVKDKYYTVEARSIEEAETAIEKKFSEWERELNAL